jgi:hypothetical protein
VASSNERTYHGRNKGKKKMTIKSQKNITALFLVITLLSFVNASGVSSPYWDGNPLQVNPGETRLVNLSLQNMVGSEDIIFEAKLSSEGNIATLVNSNSDSTYLVPFGSKDIPVTIQIQVPNNAKAGTTYKVDVLLNEVSSKQGGMLHVTSSVSTSFPVEIMGNNSTFFLSGYTIWILIGAILLVAAGIFCIKRRTKKSRK